MVQRRERGEGSLTYDRNANRWVGRLDLGPDQNGRRQRLNVTADPAPRHAAGWTHCTPTIRPNWK